MTIVIHIHAKLVLKMILIHMIYGCVNDGKLSFNWKFIFIIYECVFVGTVNSSLNMILI